jgi:hypothetical protein
LAHLFEEIPEVSDYWEVACDGMVSLSEIMNRDDCDDQKHESENEQYRHERSGLVLVGSVRRGPRGSEQYCRYEQTSLTFTASLAAAWESLFHSDDSAASACAAWRQSP